MLLQIQDALLPVLLSGAIGLLIGAGLTAWLMNRPAPGRAVDAKPAAPDRAADGHELAVAPAPVTGAALAPKPSTPMPLPTPTPPTAPLPAQLPLVADLLLVDDSAVARAKLRRLFEPAGYKVQLACDGVEALVLLDKGRYAMMITDLEVPNMDGTALINTCLGRPDTARMPILAVSGHEGLRVKFNECQDIAGVHRKPWIDDILMSHVDTLVGARQVREPAVIS